MNSATDGLKTHENSPINKHFHPILKFTSKNERKIIKVFLLSHIYQLLCDSLQSTNKPHQNHSATEYYAMDSKIIQLLVQSIVETEEYTLEGIAYYTRIPFDVIYDAACGISNQFSIAPWARIVDLYLKVKPDVTQVLAKKLLEIRDKNVCGFSSLLNEV